MGAGKGSALIAEEFRFEQGLRKRSTVQRDKWFFSASTLKMDSTSHKFFSGARFAANQHGGVGLRHLRDLLARYDVLLKVNTGMNRLGVPPSQFFRALETLQGLSNVGRIGLMTHFACADDATGIGSQGTVFQRLTGHLTLEKSLANSAAIFRYPESHADWVRPGISLYGASPFADRSAPYSAEAELAVLGGMLIDADALTLVPGIGRKGAARLREAWTRPRHGRWQRTVYYAPPEVAGYLTGQLGRIRPRHPIQVHPLPEVPGTSYLRSTAGGVS